MAARKVYFYRVRAGLDQAGRPVPIAPERIFGAIHREPFTSAGKYLEEADGDVTCCWVDRQTTPTRVGLGTIRRANLPQLERKGVLGPLPIPPDAGIVEQTHFVFFPTGIVGCLFNFYGPRASKLRYYMIEKAPRQTPDQLKFEILLRQDVLEQLDRLRHVRVLELTITRSFIDSVQHVDDSLGAAFRAAAQAGNADQIELVLRPRRYSRNWLSDGLIGSIRRLARRDHLREEVSSFKVKGLDPETDTLERIDVLKDQFVVEMDVQLHAGRVRAVVPASAYQAIEGAYAQIRQQLVRAAGAA